MRMNALWFGARAATLFCVPAVLLSFAVSTPLYAEAQTAATPKDVTVEDSVPVQTQTATAFSVTPVVANEKAKPRDIIKKELIVTNNTNHRLNLYISVENIDPTNGAEEFVSPGIADLSRSLANWIEITRGVIELSANESRKVPYLIHVNLTAIPGSYFARILFQEGARRPPTETIEDGTSLLLNVEVLDDAKERLQLGNFTSSNSVVFGDNVAFSYLLKNVSNRDIEPRGSIRIFNRRGEEVGSVPLNADGTGISPENKKQLAAAWSAAGRFGKYKAFLDLEYGKDQLASVQDTVYFWVFPWKEIGASLLGVLVLAVVGTYIVHTRALARPVPARRSTDPEPLVQEAAPAHSMRAAFETQQSKLNSPTVLVGRRQQDMGAPLPVAARENTAPRATTNGDTVELRSRHTRPGATVHGNTVELTRGR